MRVLRLSSTAQLERSANEAENLNKSLGFRPLGLRILTKKRGLSPFLLKPIHRLIPL
jgi:hypothetical protein